MKKTEKQGPMQREGKPGQEYVETLDVDGRRIDVYELFTGEESEGFDIYDADDDDDDPLNLGDILLARPTVVSVRNYLEN